MMIVITALYVLFIIVLIIRLITLPRVEQVPKSIQPALGISIIIPFRNEADNLEQLLTTLAQQKVTIPFEIVLVNDSSDDHYLPIIKTAQDNYQNCTILLVDNHFDPSLHLTSKQQAIDIGVNQAKYDLLVFTDADMEYSRLWLSNLTGIFDHESRPFIFGRTEIANSNSILSFVQKIQLDFLFGTAWLFAKMNIDTSCMGNNIALSRKLYDSFGGQKGLGYSIVEDKKLLSAVKKRGITPLPSIPFTPDAKTFPVTSTKLYLHQMLRWLKGGSGESLQILGIIILLGGELLAISMMILGSVSLPVSSITVVGVILTWILFILLFARLQPAARGFQLPLFFLILIIESLIVLPSLLFISPKWKGRSLTKKENVKC